MTDKVIVNGAQLRAIDVERASFQKQLDKQQKKHERELLQYKKTLDRLMAAHAKEQLAALKKLAKVINGHDKEVTVLRKTITAIDAVSAALAAALDSDGKEGLKVRKALGASRRIGKFCRAARK